LGIYDNAVNFPVLMTEAFVNPNYSWSMVSELLFECYQIPKLTYCVDFLLSLYYNQIMTLKHVPLTGLIISSSNSVSHVVPVIEGKTLTEISKRISLGGADHFSTL